MNDLVTLENNLTAMSSEIGQAIPPQANLPVERMIRTIVVSCERTPKLLQCKRQSLINSAWSAACLGLECDGVTGQAYLIPYKGQATLQIGFKGFSTLAARSGFMLHGGVIRDGDDYDVVLGDNGHISVKPALGAGKNRKVIAAWASMTSLRYPSIVDVMDVDDIEKVRRSSMNANGGPWTQWYDQMAIKTVKKRLAKSSPLNLMHLASALDDQSAIGNAAYIRPEDQALVIDGDADEVFTDKLDDTEKVWEPAEGPFVMKYASGKTNEFDTVQEWASNILRFLPDVDDTDRLRDFVDNNKENFEKCRQADPAHVLNVEAEIDQLIINLENEGE